MRLTKLATRQLFSIRYFFPRHTMLARVLAMALCLSVCLCLSLCVFGTGVSFHISYTLLKENSGNSKDNGTSL